MDGYTRNTACETSYNARQYYSQAQIRSAHDLSTSANHLLREVQVSVCCCQKQQNRSRSVQVTRRRHPVCWSIPDCRGLRLFDWATQHSKACFPHTLCCCLVLATTVVRSTPASGEVRLMVGCNQPGEQRWGVGVCSLVSPDDISGPRSVKSRVQGSRCRVQGFS